MSDDTTEQDILKEAENTSDTVFRMAMDSGADYETAKKMAKRAGIIRKNSWPEVAKRFLIEKLKLIIGIIITALIGSATMYAGKIAALIEAWGK